MIQKLKVEYWAEGVDPDFDEKVAELAEGRGLKFYSAGYSMVENIRDLNYELRMEEEPKTEE